MATLQNQGKILKSSMVCKVSAELLTSEPLEMIPTTCVTTRPGTEKGAAAFCVASRYPLLILVKNARAFLAARLDCLLDLPSRIVGLLLDVAVLMVLDE